MPVFDAIAGQYDDWYESPLGSFADEVETRLVFDLLVPVRGMKILDAGCGTGNFSIKLARIGAQVTGIDLSVGMLAVARDKASSGVEAIGLMKMDICSLDFDDDTFDAVLCMTAFEFIADPDAAFAELMRVVKPGGRIVIGTIHRESLWAELYDHLASQDETCIYRHAQFKSLADLEDLDRGHYVKGVQGLFISPFTPLERLTWEEEAARSSVNTGGFIAALWEKPVV